jgi:hypothetical protein
MNAAQRVTDHRRLLADLLQHEMAKFLLQMSAPDMQFRRSCSTLLPAATKHFKVIHRGVNVGGTPFG